MSIFSKLALVFSTGVLCASCQTVSGQAPGEIQNAEKVVKNAKSENMNNLMPRASELADRKLARSLELLDDAAEYREKGQEAQADATQKQAIVLANEARAIAEMGMGLQRDAEKFDENLTEYVPMIQRAELSASLQGEVSELKRQNEELTSINSELTSKNSELATSASTVPVVDERLPADFRMGKTVAYFSSGSTRLDAKYRQDAQEIADILKTNPELYLTLEGYADPRGSLELNRKLAEKRAQSVVQFLEQSGIGSDRIRVEVVGATAEARGGRDAAALQLDRKVVAKFQTTAH
jgi:outer membrane protein OmpA-like peptidoglycan-associated protein